MEQVKKNKKTHIVVTGGGSGGHTIPALVMIKHWTQSPNIRVDYIGSQTGIERTVTGPHVYTYYPIYTGKLRRYFSLENFLDFFKFFLGIFQSLFLLIKNRPDAIFSTGGFVALPVVIAAFLLRIKVIIHEQTTHVGLANKLSSYLADKVCISFQSSKVYFPKNKTVFTGYPLRPEFKDSLQKLNSFQGREFPSSKKILLILGGGNGSVLLNRFVKKHLAELTEQFSVVLQTGKAGEAEFNFTDPSLWTFTFLENEMPSLIKTADYIIARSGAGTVCELIFMQKACLFVPLAIAQKNEQWFNALEAQKIINSVVVSEKEWNELKAVDVINKLQQIQVTASQTPATNTIPAQLIIDEIVLGPAKK